MEVASSATETAKPTANFIFEEDDLPYEEDLIRNPYSLKCWMRYIEHKRQTKASTHVINFLYERALKELPGSYKLWYQYLRLRCAKVKKLNLRDPAYEDVNLCFRRALVFMHKMPRIWLDYCDFLIQQKRVTLTRKTFDEALRSLPITQHDRIWPLYLKFVRSFDIPETAIRVYRRYLKLSPENAEEYIEYLQSIDQLDEAARRLAICVNDDKFTSKKGKSNHQLWQELCDLISKNPIQIRSLKVEPIIRQGIRRYTDQVGTLWCSLSEYYIRSGHFERSRDLYEEAIQTVTTVRDFVQVFDAYAQFMEQVIQGKMEQMQGVVTDDDDLELELFMARFENLMDRRPLLLNSVLLRQNPHNVHEWLKRVELYEGSPHKQIETFTEALKTVDPKMETGKLCTLWIAFAKFYEQHGQVEDARNVFEKALEVLYTKVEDLAAVWCEYAEMELRARNWQGAVKLMKRATAPPPQKTDYYEIREPVQRRVHKSLKVWCMYADLEESFGTFESCKAVYDRVIDLRIASPQIIMNFGMFLEENNHFEEAFKAYEKGIALFSWPHVYDIWNTYLVKFIKRYGGKKLERIRDLFEQCLEYCPPEFAKHFFLLYAKVEEEHGQARHVMNIYSRASEKVPREEMYDVFNIYIKKAAELFGVTHTRTIYERAIEILPDDKEREMCIRFAELECKLGEIDRARAIYAHCSQICDPRVYDNFWEAWKAFEVKHGNEDTVREMLRIKRSVQATFNTQVNVMSAQMLAAASGQSKTTADITAGDSMAMLEAKAQQLAEEAKKDTPKIKAGNIAFVRATSTEKHGESEIVVDAANPDEIQLDDDEDAMGEDNADVEEQVIPSEVFGNLAPEDDENVTAINIS